MAGSGDSEPLKPAASHLLSVIKESVGLIRPDAGLFLFVLAVNLLGAVLTGIGDPIALKFMIDSLAVSDVRFFLIVAGLMVFIYTSFRLLSLVSNLSSQRLRNRLCDRLVSSLVRKFYRLQYREVRDRERGYFISRLYDEPAKIRQAVSLVVELFSALAISLCAISVCLFLSWRVSLIVSCIVPVLVFLSRKYGARIRNKSLQETEDEAQVREALGRAVESYKNVRIFSLQEAVSRRFDGLLQALLGSTYSRYKQSATYATWSGILLSTAETSVMIVAGFQVLQGRLSLGGLFGFVAAYWRVVNSFQSLTTLIPSLATLGAQLERVRAIESMPEVADTDQELLTGGSDGGMTGGKLDSLTYGYGEQPVIENLSLSWQPGERLLVVGANGSGKSTLAHLLLGFLVGQKGEARTPGLATTSAQLSSSAFVLGNLADNLEHSARSSAGPGYGEELIKSLGLDDKLQRDPASFSDGEKKKALLAMALLKDADLYLFDEPLANIDPESKDLIVEKILERTKDSGLIVILHGDEQYWPRFDRVIDLANTRPPILAAAAG